MTIKQKNNYDFIYTDVGFYWYVLQYQKRSKKLTKNEKENKEKEFNEWIEKRKKIQSKSRSRNTIRKNISEKQLNYSVLFTLQPDKHNICEKVLKRSLTQLLRRYNIPYVLVPEYHQSGVIHFHGFVRIENSKDIQVKMFEDKPVIDKYNNIVYEFLPLEKNYGFTQLKSIENKSSIEKALMINYVSKYISKGDSKLMSSRFGRRDALALALDWFGSEKVLTIKK